MPQFWAKKLVSFINVSINLTRRALQTTGNSMSRGAFIVFEGCDRCGKTTQGRLLAKSLQAKGIPAEFMHFPDRGTVIGQVIDRYLNSKENLDDHAIHLLFAANRWEKRSDILQRLIAGTTLIVDRYSFSGVAYSAAKEGMSFDWCRQVEVGLPAPDAVVFLELSQNIAATREQFGEERYENPKTQTEVLKIYDKLKDECWVTVDANKTVEDLQEELMSIATAVVSKTKDVPVKTLWTPS